MYATTARLTFENRMIRMDVTVSLKTFWKRLNGLTDTPDLIEFGRRDAIAGPTALTMFVNLDIMERNERATAAQGGSALALKEENAQLMVHVQISWAA
jgi:hypothetical protein